MKLFLFIMMAGLVSQIGWANAQKGCGPRVLPVPANKLVLEVEPTLVPTEMIHLGRPLKIYPTHVRTANHHRTLSEFPVIQEPALDTVEIEINGRDVSVSKHLQFGLVAYLRRDYFYENFDCHSFMSGLFAFDYIQICRAMLELGALFQSAPNEALLVPGDGIALAKSFTTENEIVWGINHSAMFLAPGHYLSKIGKLGPVVVTTFEELNAFYGTDSVLQLPFETGE
jgi:hypothetical protein